VTILFFSFKVIAPLLYLYFLLKSHSSSFMLNKLSHKS